MKRKLNDYIEIRDWLETFIPLVYGKEELGLARIEYLLELLENPQNKFKSIHVAGTSGKGSTAYYIAKLLSSQFTVNGSRSKIGLHISPHLVDIRERMQIFQSSITNYKKEGLFLINQKVQITNESLMPMGRFLRLFSEIKPLVERIQKEKPELAPSYFEILAAATFKYFAEEKVDWAVVEVGLGGRLDATNVLMPEVSVITNIGLDHMEILGDTVQKIAREKAGIVKPNTPIVTGAKGTALGVIEKVAREKGAEVFTITNSKKESLFLINQKVQITKKKKIGGNLNWELARKVVEVALWGKDKNIQPVILSPKDEESQHRSFASLRMTKLDGLPGRFEEIDEGVILDGAHNPDKIQAVLEFIRKWKVNSDKCTVFLVVAFKKGKNWQEMVDILLKNLPIQTIFATQYQTVTDTGKGSAVDPEEIRDYAAKVHSVKCKVISDSQEAVFEAIQATSNQQPATILVTGSLYLVGEVRTMWKLPSFA